ncbi:MAG: hypothetical protein IJX28_07075 [Clostridia bacterium]|nr:hypothetical protein [Clostridia bacterium]
MDIILPLLAVVAVLLAIPGLRWIYKRVTLAVKLKACCKSKGFRLVGNRPLWMFGTSGGSVCDCYIETARTLYAVKLFSTPSKRSTLVFDDKGHYCFQKKIPLAGGYGGSIEYPKESRHRPMPAYDFRRGYRMEWEIKTPVRVLLINPVCREIRYASLQGGGRMLGAGDMVNNCRIYPLSRFLGELEAQR